MTKKQSIIFFEQRTEQEKIPMGLSYVLEENNFSVIREIVTPSFTDLESLSRLIYNIILNSEEKKADLRKKEPITIIIDKNFSHRFSNILLCLVLSTLLAAGLIELCYYDSNFKLSPFEEKENIFACLTASYVDVVRKCIDSSIGNSY